MDNIIIGPIDSHLQNHNFIKFQWHHIKLPFVDSVYSFVRLIDSFILMIKSRSTGVHAMQWFVHFRAFDCSLADCSVHQMFLHCSEHKWCGMMTEFFIIIYLHYGNVLGSSCIEITSGAIHKCSQPHLDRLSVCHFSFFLKREKKLFSLSKFFIHSNDIHFYINSTFVFTEEEIPKVKS